VARPADAAGEWAAFERPILLVGSGLRKYGALFAESLGENAAFAAKEAWRPSAWGLLGAYAAAVTRGERGDGDPGKVLPIYTRLSDAEEAETARDAITGGTLPASGAAGATER
jgi:N6-L-threonylcarbamoyladenine synthase